MERYRKLGQEVLKKQAELRKECEKYIKDSIYNHLRGEGTLEFEEEVMDEKDINAISVPYNGGNHPEYASNCYSMLQAITLDYQNGEYNILLSIEDDDEYPLEEVGDMDVYNIAYFLEEYLC